MNEQRLVRTCTVCGQETECTPAVFTGTEKASLKAYTGKVTIYDPSEFTLYICDNCGLQKGTVPKKAWIFAIVGHVLMVIGLVLMLLSGSGRDTADLFPLGLVFFGLLGWIIATIAGCVLMAKLRFEAPDGGFKSILGQMVPVLSLIQLIRKSGAINRCYRAFSALKPEAELNLQRRKEHEQELNELVESGKPLTAEQEAERVSLEKDRQKKEQIAQGYREQLEERTSKGNMTGSVIGLLITIGLAIWGISVYSSGRGYMTLFRTIKLSPGAFAAVIGVFLLFDIISIVSAVKNRKK